MGITVYIGGDFRQAYNAAKSAAADAREPWRNGRSEHHVPVDRVEALLGLDRDTDVVLLRSFWSRGDVHEMLRWCRRFRGFNEQESTRAA